MSGWVAGTPLSSGLGRFMLPCLNRRAVRRHHLRQALPRAARVGQDHGCCGAVVPAAAGRPAAAQRCDLPCCHHPLIHLHTHVSRVRG